MRRLFGPYRVSRLAGLAAFLGLAFAWHVEVGVDLLRAMAFAAVFTLLAGVSASWGFGRCGFTRTLDAMDAYDLGLRHDDRH